ncbi:HAD family hydrolase [Mycolicibacter sinensis]|uniref:HAD family hydrolase n=1 Tax=Mycolicibacter sinensis (strain JDM601) TaxID=875328 RepID=UPI00130199E5|nr:HAD family phosphatase [Mycolicibacter sinensis]
MDPFEACRVYARELGIPSDTFVHQLRGPVFAEVECGLRTIRDFLKFACRDVSERLGVAVDIRHLADCLAAGQRVRPEMVTLIGDLTARGIKVGVLTNNAKEAASWWRSGVLPVESFTAVVDSSQVGLRKPDPAIYALTAERMGSRAEELLYFDDLDENVNGAVSAGLAGELFTDAASCRAVCAQRGLI